MSNLKLSPREEYDIAEFIYSYLFDMLIKTDAYMLIHILIDHNVIKNEPLWMANIDEGKSRTVQLLYTTVTEWLGKDYCKDLMTRYLRGEVTGS